MIKDCGSCGPMISCKLLVLISKLVIVKEFALKIEDETCLY